MSGLETREEVNTIDYATPMRSDGTYPEGLAVYYKGRLFPEIVPWHEIAGMALLRHELEDLESGPDSLLIHRETRRELKRIWEFYWNNRE